VQVNGGGGALLNDAPSVETVRTIATSHRRFGTVGMLPTVITDAPQVIARAVASVARAMGEGVPGVLGIHIEGPFLDVARKGAHAARFIREMEEADADAIAGFAMYCPVMLTLAPNRVTPALVKRLTRAGVLVSLGHSDASYAEARAALDAGAHAFTHLYNAMSQMTGREPGMVGAALTDAEAYVGIIADGHHVHDAALKAAFGGGRAGRFRAAGAHRDARQGAAVAGRRHAGGLRPHHGCRGSPLRGGAGHGTRAGAAHGLAEPRLLPALRA